MHKTRSKQDRDVAGGGGVCTYVSVLVERVVGEFEFLERDGLSEQLVAAER